MNEHSSEENSNIECTKDKLVDMGMIVPISINEGKKCDLEDIKDFATVTRPDVDEEEGTKNDEYLPDARSGTEMAAFDRITVTSKISSHEVCCHVYVAPIQDSVFIGFDALASLDTFIFAGQGDSWIGKGVNVRTLSCYDSAIRFDERCWLPPGS
jgi:hypothetical protein